MVIGGQRCGTTYLHGLLDGHPDITMAQPARPEPKVFCSEEKSARAPEWYRATYFGHAHGEHILGDKSTSYLEDPAAPGRARTMLGRAFVVALLRDPVRRAVSNWRFSTDNGFETRPLAQALETNLREQRDWDPERTSVSPFAYLERGRYLDHLGPWLDAFGDSTSVLFTDELVGDETVIADLYAWLGVDAGFRPRRGEGRVNASESQAPALPAGLLAELRDYFEAPDRALADRLGRTLPWAAEAAEGEER